MKTVCWILGLMICTQTAFSQETWKDASAPVDERVTDLISKLTLEEKCSQMLYDSRPIDRLGIAGYNWWSEALHGVARMGRATVFPQPLGLAATFDTGLVFRIASAISDEARIKHNAALRLNNITVYGGLSFWSPNINIFRDPRWGRGMETWGEDPCLTGALGVQFVRGMQGNDPKYLKTAACAKHFVVHSGPEKSRHEFDARPPIKDFYETYLPAFETLVKQGHVEAVMCAYNRTYGEPCCGSSFLLQDILRKDWGFTGHIVSDCWAITDFNQFHKVTQTVEESAAKALKAGVNLNCGVAYRSLAAAVRNELVTGQDVDRELAPLLRTRFRLGLFDRPGSTPWDSLPETMLNCPKFKSLAREAAAKSVVMLKNVRGLPLRPDLKHIVVTGPMAADVNVLLGNYNGVPSEAMTILEGITAAVNAGTRISYHQGILLTGEDSIAPKRVIPDMNNADATIVVIGINPFWEGEEGEAIATRLGADKSDISLPANQLAFLREIAKKSKAPLITVVTGCSALDLREVYALSDAVLLVWYPGEQGGNGVADIIFGKRSPSGRLPVTFPVSLAQLPPFDDYAMAGRTYKYLKGEPQFPFGFGLGYSNVSYSDLMIRQTSVDSLHSVDISFRATNSGEWTVDEVVQLYIAHQGLPFRVPASELIRFGRISLAPGSSKIMSYTLSPGELKVIDMDGSKRWFPGDLTIWAGSCSPGARGVALGAPSPATGNITLK